MSLIHEINCGCGECGGNQHIFPPNVPSSRRIDTKHPLKGGGDLSVDRIHYIPPSTNDQDGYLTKEDHRLLGLISAVYRIIAGSATWSGTGLTFDITQVLYRLGTIYQTPGPTTVTLSPADPVNPRIDVIYVASDSQVHVKTGTPSPSPLKPTLTQETEIELTFVLIGAGATVPTGISEVLVYDELVGPPTEWTTTTNDAIHIDLASNDTPSTGAKNIKKDTDGPDLNRKLITYTAPTAFLIDDFEYLKFRFLFESEPTKTCAIITFKKSGQVIGNVAVQASIPAQFGFNPTLTDTWQQIVIPKNQIQWLIDTLTFDQIEFDVTSDNFISKRHFDRVILQGGNNPPTNTVVLSFNTRTGHIISAVNDYIVLVTTGTFPLEGNPAKLYVNTSNNSIWYWDTTSASYKLTGSSGGIAQKKYYAADFSTPTTLVDSWLNGKNISIFWNDVNRYLLDSEYTLIGDTLTVLISGFDGTTIVDKLIITETTN